MMKYTVEDSGRADGVTVTRRSFDFMVNGRRFNFRKTMSIDAIQHYSSDERFINNWNESTIMEAFTTFYREFNAL